jgi:GDPmannose 4,6-dehydratase
VVATGETWTVRDFLDRAFGRVGLDWKSYVEFDERYLRPSEVDLLIGDPSKAKRKLGWTARTSFDELVRLMVDADLEAEGQLHRVRG